MDLNSSAGYSAEASYGDHPSQGQPHSIPSGAYLDARDPSFSKFQQSTQQTDHSIQPVDSMDQHARSSPSIAVSRPRLPTASSLDSSVMNVEDISLHPKVVNILADTKRGGRMSPLPQAVQGAQARMKGPASEPGIKNEFARMFSGLSTGVGSAVASPAPPEHQTPASLPSSPTRHDEPERQTPLGLKEIGNTSKPRTTAKGGKRSRKVRDDDIKKELEVENGVQYGLTRSLSGKGPKKNRQSYYPSPTPLSQA